MKPDTIALHADHDCGHGTYLGGAIVDSGKFDRAARGELEFRDY